jgi:putative aldouronate transport system substrate-binding protein
MFGLLPGCGKNESPEETQPPQDDGLPYHFAPGDYEVNEEGFPVEPYEYKLPICNTSEVLTYMFFTPDTEHWENIYELPQIRQIREFTGVNIEYDMLKVSNMYVYQTVMAADYYCDIITGPKQYIVSSYAENKSNWCNLRDYLEYCPNYMYQVTCNPEEGLMYDALYYDEDTIPFFYTLLDKAVIHSNYMARGDWLYKAGLSNDDIVTWDDLHEMLTLFQLNQDTCEEPMGINITIDSPEDFAFTSFDTYPYIDYDRLGPAYVVNGKVRFACMNENDREFATMLHQWYEEKLLNRELIERSDSFRTYGFSFSEFNDYLIENGRLGYARMAPHQAMIYEQETPDAYCRWVPIRKPLRTEGQTLHLGGRKNRVLYGAAAISIRCENIPLAVTWLDFRYSPTGSYALSYGPEGYLWEWDENNNPKATDKAMEAGYAGFEIQSHYYGLNIYQEPGLELLSRRFIVPGGERQYAAFEYWDGCSYDGAYEWPKGVEFTEEHQKELVKLSKPIVNYISSRYFGFIDGSWNLAEWDDYIQRLYELEMNRVIEIYQDAYNKHIEKSK